MSVLPGRFALWGLSLASALLLACSPSLIGDSCELPGATNDEVAYQSGTDDCGGAMCLYREGSGTFCTEDCGSDADCPHGMSCQPVDLNPTPRQEEIRSLCVPEDQGSGDDDDDVDDGVPPEISELEVWHGADLQTGQCTLYHSFHWHDEDGDLSGAVAYAEYLDPEDPDNPVYYMTTLEMLDQVDVDLQFQAPHDGEGAAYSTTYNVYVEIEDRAGHLSNQLVEGGYTTPDAQCE